MEILEKVKSSFPKDVVEKVELEGCEIVVYTKDKVFFLDAAEQVRELVSEIKKRIEVRLTNNICMQPEEAKKKIMEYSLYSRSKTRHRHRQRWGNTEED
jgi:predicted metal-dependent RNase